MENMSKALKRGQGSEGPGDIVIEPDDADQRLDRFLRRRFPELPQSHIEKICRKGKLRLDGARVKPATRLEAGQSLRLPPFLARTGLAKPALARAQPAIDARQAKMIRGRVLYRDDELLILDKPAGLAVQGGSGTKTHIDGLAEALRFDAPAKPMLVHRLDRDVSGVLVMARSRGAARALGACFSSLEARKTYWALVAGVPKSGAGRIDFPLIKRAGPGGREMMRAIMDPLIELGDEMKTAKNALSAYRHVASPKNGKADYAPEGLSWLLLSPITGRTHQLRVHSAALGHPIMGDRKYVGEPAKPGAPKTRERGQSAQNGAASSLKGGLYLHAREIAFPHPTTKKTIRIKAPLPDHMKSAWRHFGWDEEMGDTLNDAFWAGIPAETL